MTLEEEAKRIREFLANCRDDMSGQAALDRQRLQQIEAELLKSHSNGERDMDILKQADEMMKENIKRAECQNCGRFFKPYLADIDDDEEQWDICKICLESIALHNHGRETL